MEYYELHPETPQRRYIDKAIEVLRGGGVIIYPTDTTYGLGCDVRDQSAIKRVLDVKNETSEKLLSFVIPDLKDVASYAKVSDYAYKTMKRLLPGPYTFILPAAKEIPKKLWSKRKTVGIRVPAHPVARELASGLGAPIVNSSVTNRVGDLLLNPDEIRAVLNAQVDLMLAAGALSGEPSSVVDLSGDEPEIVREGAGEVEDFR
ncbi:MAG: threonylcarbamoyl-AMP synthase [Ignavibacteriales bacterium]|jgi:tRNA threonylcarbamoyl adenosine modification protein (Sua5/YciO/YrdC/YwlC family)|nr:threonylcarbamoyl-AMP synthase [Ignavibacteriales bacterium]